MEVTLACQGEATELKTETAAMEKGWRKRDREVLESYINKLKTELAKSEKDLKKMKTDGE